MGLMTRFQSPRLADARPPMHALLEEARAQALIAHCIASPIEIACTQGVHRYRATRVAVSGQAALFLAHETRQFGVGRAGGIPTVVEEAYQYPALRVAMLMFLELARGSVPG